jgi:hypothetical protein
MKTVFKLLIAVMMILGLQSTTHAQTTECAVTNDRCVIQEDTLIGIDHQVIQEFDNEDYTFMYRLWPTAPWKNILMVSKDEDQSQTTNGYAVAFQQVFKLAPEVKDIKITTTGGKLVFHYKYKKEEIILEIAKE